MLIYLRLYESNEPLLNFTNHALNYSAQQTILILECLNFCGSFKVGDSEKWCTKHHNVSFWNMGKINSQFSTLCNYLKSIFHFGDRESALTSSHQAPFNKHFLFVTYAIFNFQKGEKNATMLHNWQASSRIVHDWHPKLVCQLF